MSNASQRSNAMGGGSGAPQRGGKKSDQELLTMVREKLKSRGTRSIVGLGRTFKIFDDNGDHRLDANECLNAMNDLRMGFTKEECANLFKIFDSTGEGFIDYDEFLLGVRGEMN